MASKIMIPVTVRPATEADIPAIEILITPYVDDGTLLPRTVDELRELMENFFVAEIEGRLVGCAALEIYSWKLAEIRSLAVDASVHGAGIGKLLVQACVQRARDRNILEVMAITASEDFFRACGFDFTLPGLKKALFFQSKDS